jgi:preprotein translocase subunit SecG
MSIVLGLLTVVMVLDCILLVFLILLQLPKKEAGAGMAFGGGATDALFGAGSGNVLTKVTKYVAGVFFGLALIMAVVTANLNRPRGSDLLNALDERPSASKAFPTTATPATNSRSTPLLNMGTTPAAPASAASNASGGSSLALPPPSTPTNK